MPKVTFLPEDITVEARPGTILLDVALDNNVRINHNCGGNCACATCHVHIEKGFDTLNPPSEQELDMLQEAENLQQNSRLSCQCLVENDLVVSIPPSDFDDEDLI